MSAYQTTWIDEELTLLQDACRKFYANEMVPREEAWQKQGYVDKDFWRLAGDAGILCASVPEAYGGAGGSFYHEAIIVSEQFRAAGYSGFGNYVHSQICADYFVAYGTEDQKRKYLPKMATGEWICAIAMTEPGTGSDLQSVKTNARLEGNQYVVNGSKTFITNGQMADIILLVAKTDPEKGSKGISLFIVETDGLEGFKRGRNLDKIGMKSQDTSELFFDNVHLTPDCLLGGEENQGFAQLMNQLPQERLALAIAGVAVMEKAVEVTADYTRERKAFGKTVLDFQNTKFKLAEAKTIAHVARVFIDNCIERHVNGGIDAATASMAKWWVTQMQCDVVDECLQLHGGYGYMMEYPIAQMYADSRVQKIYGGTNEIMKELIARTL
ncbi:MAG: acyl-CoA dehydrogenase family protein [Pseudomonadota bacterium]